MSLQLKHDQRGFSLHIVVPLFAIICIAIVGTFLIHVSRAASNPYNGTCTSTIIRTTTTVTTTKYKNCILQAQELMDAIQRENYDSYRTAIKSVPDAFSSGAEYYIVMNGIYSTATAYAVKALPNNSTNNALTNSPTSGSWQILCSDAVSAGLAAGGKAADYTLTIDKNVNGEYNKNTNASTFQATCGNLPSTIAIGGSGTAVSGGSKMIVGVNVNGLGSNPGPDMSGAVKYVRVDLKSWGLNASTFTNSGIKVDDLLQGPYSTSGISGLGSPTTWAANALGWYKADGCTPTLCPIIEVLNEPGGTWFWGSNSLSVANATAYDNILIATYNAFKTAYGTSRPTLLASFDGGYSTGSDWGQYMWQANSKIGNYIDGITAHPYDTNSTGLGSQSNVTNSYNQAKSLAGRSIPMYITEIGWQTTPVSADDGDPPQSGTVLLSATEQCSNVYNFVSWARSLGYVNAVMLFDYRDDNASAGDGTYGIEYGNGTHKPSYAALEDAALNKADPC